MRTLVVSCDPFDLRHGSRAIGNLVEGSAKTACIPFLLCQFSYYYFKLIPSIWDIRYTWVLTSHGIALFSIHLSCSSYFPSPIVHDHWSLSSHHSFRFKLYTKWLKENLVKPDKIVEIVVRLVLWRFQSQKLRWAGSKSSQVWVYKNHP